MENIEVPNKIKVSDETEDFNKTENIEEAKLGKAARKKSATIGPSKKHPTGRFPINDKKHARLAIQMLPKAKGLSSDDKAKIRAKATKMLGHKTPSTGGKKK